MVQSLRTAVYGLCVVVLSFGFLFSLAGGQSRMMPYVRYLLSLVILLMLLSPLLPLLRTLGDRIGITPPSSVGEEVGKTVYEETAVAYAKERCAWGVGQWIATKTGIPYASIAVDLSLDASDPEAVVILSAEVTLFGGQYRILGDKVKDICEALLCCPCTVMYRSEGAQGGDTE